MDIHFIYNATSTTLSERDGAHLHGVFWLLSPGTCSTPLFVLAHFQLALSQNVEHNQHP